MVSFTTFGTAGSALAVAVSAGSLVVATVVVSGVATTEAAGWGAVSGPGSSPPRTVKTTANAPITKPATATPTIAFLREAPVASAGGRR